MSMFDDVLGFGRTSVMESMSVDALEPEIAGMTLEDAEMLDESVDLTEYILGVAHENDMNMAKLNSAIMGDEYRYLRENGVEMIYEEGGIKSIIDRFVDMVKKLWRKIQSFFKTIFAKLESLFRSDEKFLAKYKSQAAGKTSGKIKGNKAYIENYGANKNNATKLMDKIKDKIVSINSNNDLGVKSGTDKDAVLKSLGLGDGSTKDILKAINPDLANDKAELDGLSTDKAISILESASKDKADVKSLYNKNKINIDSMIKQAKRMEKEAKQNDKKDKASNIHANISIMNKLGSVMTSINHVAIKNINTSRSMAKAIILSAIRKSSENKVGESASLVDALDFN